jgi:hypothetical protein
MNLAVLVDTSLPGYRVDLPRSFLEMILEESEFNTSPRCICIQTDTQKKLVTTMRSFTDEMDVIRMSIQCSDFLGLTAEDTVRVEYIDGLVQPYLIDIQAENESFGDTKDVREKLESLIAIGSPCITVGMSFLIDNERVYLVKIYDKNDQELPYALADSCELRVNFLETIESIRLKKEEAERQEAERIERERVFRETHCVGGRELSREERLEKLLARIKKSY